MTTLSSVLSPAFYHLHKQIKAGTANKILCAGGRGSTKSSFIGVEIILELVKNPHIHAVVFRRYGNTLKGSVFNQLLWAIDALGLSGVFYSTTSPLEITYKPTKQKIYFRGLDDPLKAKSIKAPFGHIGILWFEELDQFRNAAEIRSVEQSVIRGGDYALIFKSFNPPPMQRSWANQYALEQEQGKIVHRSTYLTTPPRWLGKVFLDAAEHLKATNPTAYAHEYLGEIVGTGTEVFSNVQPVKFTEQQVHDFDYTYHGVDWGWYPDPWAYNACSYDAARSTLRIYDELTRTKTPNRDTAQLLIARGVEQAIIADSAEPKSIADYRAYGLNCRKCDKGSVKGVGSIAYSMKWLQGLARIEIDPDRCPETFKEFSEYEYEKDKQGEILGGYPDFANHHIDAVRYAMTPVWKRKGE